jgi:hypothetical protein
VSCEPSYVQGVVAITRTDVMIARSRPRSPERKELADGDGTATRRATDDGDDEDQRPSWPSWREERKNLRLGRGT